MLGLAAPLAVAELGWMIMGTVDMLMAGRLSAAAVGAGSVANMVFYPIAVSGTGVLLGMDTLVAHAFGAEDPKDCRRTLVNGIWLAAALFPLLGLAIRYMIPVLAAAGTNPRVMALLAPYLKALIPGLAPLLLFAAFRRYLQAINIVRPVTFALISANVVNFVGNWVLMFGHWGVRPMGLTGSGWSTSISRLYMAAVLLAVVVWHECQSGSRLFRLSWRPDWARTRRLVGLGLPAAMQLAVEGAGFTAVTVLAARLSEVELAAHSITTNVIATTYMVPLGISSAAAVRVGHALGRKDRFGAAVAGWTALAISAAFMGSASLLLWSVPRLIVRAFIADRSVTAAGAVLLRIAGLFQIFDGLQVTATGALRGLGETRAPMRMHLAGYWAVGIPLAYVLCFPSAWGVTGIWVGLTAAVILAGVSLVAVWRARLAITRSQL